MGWKTRIKKESISLFINMIKKYKTGIIIIFLIPVLLIPIVFQQDITKKSYEYKRNRLKEAIDSIDNSVFENLEFVTDIENQCNLEAKCEIGRYYDIAQFNITLDEKYNRLSIEDKAKAFFEIYNKIDSNVQSQKNRINMYKSSNSLEYKYKGHKEFYSFVIHVIGTCDGDKYYNTTDYKGIPTRFIVGKDDIEYDYSVSLNEDNTTLNLITPLTVKNIKYKDEIQASPDKDIDDYLNNPNIWERRYRNLRKSEEKLPEKEQKPKDSKKYSSPYSSTIPFHDPDDYDNPDDYADDAWGTDFDTWDEAEDYWMDW